jgi:hypothetical protein
MCITDRSNTANRAATGANTLDAIVRRWYVTSRVIRKTLAGIRDPRVRADIERLLDAYRTGKPLAAMPIVKGRAAALAATCEALLTQFDDERAGAAEIRLVVHRRDELPTDSASDPRPVSTPHIDVEDEELVWELRRLLASSGGTIADVAHALERRGNHVDRKGRDLLEDEVRAVEVDIAILKTLLSDPVDWDSECRRLLAGEVPPFEDDVLDDDSGDEDD